MKRVILAATAASCLTLSACATSDIASLMAAADQYDEDCYKNTKVTVTPILVFGWPIPLVAGSHEKLCNPDKGPRSPVSPGPAPIGVGQAVGGTAPLTP